MKKLLFLVLLLATFLFFQLFQKPGDVILVGGGSIPERTIEWLKKISGTFLVITTDFEYSERWISLLDNVLIIQPEDLDKGCFKNLAAIIIDGGDQWEYVNRLNGKLVQQAHEQGIPILGTSAGAMLLANKYFSAKNGTITSEDAKNDKNVDLAENFTKIRWLKNCIVDTHFTERNRLDRLKVFMQKGKVAKGIGIDEATAVRLNGNKIEVVGEGTVTFIDGTGKKVSYSGK